MNLNAFRSRHRVYYEDTDAGGVVYYANYLRYLERARSDWLRALGLRQEETRREQAWVFVVAELQARYLRPARLDDEIEVSARIAERTRASLVFAQEIRRGDELLLDARVRVACVDAHSFRPLRLSPELLALLPPAP